MSKSQAIAIMLLLTQSAVAVDTNTDTAKNSLNLSSPEWFLFDVPTAPRKTPPTPVMLPTPPPKPFMSFAAIAPKLETGYRVEIFDGKDKLFTSKPLDREHRIVAHEFTPSSPPRLLTFFLKDKDGVVRCVRYAILSHTRIPTGPVTFRMAPPWRSWRRVLLAYVSEIETNQINAGKDGLTVEQVKQTVAINVNNRKALAAEPGQHAVNKIVKERLPGGRIRYRDTVTGYITPSLSPDDDPYE